MLCKSILVLLQENPSGCSFQALPTLGRETWAVLMCILKDSILLCASPLGLACLWGLLERQLICVKHGERSPEPLSLSHCKDLGTAWSLLT